MKRLLLVLSLVAVIVTSTVLANPASALTEDVSDEVVQGLENEGDSGSGAQDPDQAADEQANAQGNEAAPSSDPQETLAAPSADQGVMNANSVSAVDSAAVTENGTGDSGIAVSGAEADGTEKSADQISAAEGSGTAEQGATLAEAAETVSTEEAAAEKTTEQAAQSETDVLSFADDRAQVKITRKDGTGFPSDTTMSGSPLGTDDWNRVLSAVSAKVKAQSDDSTAYSVAGLHTWTLSLQAGDGSAASYDDIRAEAEFQGGLNDAGYATKTSEKEENGTDGTSITTASYETSWRVYAISGDSIADPVEDHLTDLTDADGTSLSVDENGALQSAAFDGSLPETVVFAQIVRETVTTGTEKKKEIPMPAVTFDKEAATDHGTIMVHVEADEGTFEQGTTMSVKQVSSQDILDKAIEAAGGRGSAAAVDISFRKADGTETEPAKPIRVKMTAKVLGQADKVHVVHVDDTGSTDVVARKSDGKTIESTSGEAASSDAKNTVSFESDSFSVYAIVYTVDFEYSVNGKMYQFSLHGGEKITLSDLVEVLGIIGDTNSGEKAAFNSVEDFLKEVANVQFSDESLVKVTKNLFGNDWTLKSLEPFNTEETLTISMKNGDVVVVKVTDAQEITQNPDRMNALLDSASLTLNGHTVENGETIGAKDGDTYTLSLVFAENDNWQFVDDGTEMVYHLPAGVTLGDSAFTGNFTIDMGLDGILPDNTYTYDPATKTLKFKWNTSSPNFEALTDADNASFRINITGQFDFTTNHIEFKDDYSFTITHEEPHNADVNKSGQYYPANSPDNPYEEPAIKYTVVVKSEGETSNLQVRDTVSGSAVTLISGSALVSSNKTNNTIGNISITDKTLGLDIGSMQDGEEITITYWGRVNLDGIAQSGNATISETGNSVVVTHDNGRDEDENVVHEIDYSDFNKSAINVSASVYDAESGKTTQTITWEIVTNTEASRSIGGSTITDRISEASKDRMSYSGQGIKVYLYNADDTLANVSPNPRELSWSEVGVNTTTGSSKDTTWTYNIPSDDGNYKYVITYTTDYDITGMEDMTNAVNYSEGQGGTGVGTAPVGPGNQEQLQVLKKAVEVNNDEITWNITINVPTEGLDHLTVTDTLPMKWGQGEWQGYPFIDHVKSIEVVSGLLKDGGYNEGYEVSYNYGYTGITRPNNNPSQVVLEFYKNGTHTDENKGLNRNPAETNRTIAIKLVTKNDPDWLKYVVNSGNSDDAKHTNSVTANNKSDTDTAYPMEKQVFKARNGTQKTGEKDADVTIDGVTYPLYRFQISVAGAYEAPITVTDTFDTSLFELYSDPNDINRQTEFWGGSERTYPHTTKGEITATSTDTGITFTATSLPMNGDVPYGYYGIWYWLKPKNEAALETLRNAAMAEEDGVATYVNRAKFGDSEDTAELQYKYKVVDKKGANNNGVVSYTIDLNKDKLRLNGGNNMTMSDTYSSNLAVDFGSIEVTTDPADKKELISWDFRRNTGTFVIPDETHVTITYKARVVGDNGTTQEYSNTAYMNGYYDTDSGSQYISTGGEGSATVYRIKLFKFGEGHMEGGLNNVTFRLLDEYKQPVISPKTGRAVTFTTDTVYLNSSGVVVTNAAQIAEYENMTAAQLKEAGVTKRDGFVQIMLSQARDGIALKKETVYYLQEVEAPEGYQTDYVQYSFAISDNPEYTPSGVDGVYVYHNNDVMTVRNYPESTSLRIVKQFAGNAVTQLTDEQKAQVTFTITKLNETTNEYEPFNVTVYRNGEEVQTNVVTYADKKDAKGNNLFQSGVMTIDLEESQAGTYRVEETNYIVDTNGIVTRNTYKVDGTDTTENANPGEVTVSPDDFDENNPTGHTVEITNTYFTGYYDFTKYDNSTGALLGGATFGVFKAADDTQVGENIVTDTNQDAKFTIKKGDGRSYEDNVLYYVVETAAPEGYELPDPAPKYYFYFSADKDNPWTPEGLPEGSTAIDLTTDFASELIANGTPVDEDELSVVKEWKNSSGGTIPAGASSVEVTLKRYTMVNPLKTVNITVHGQDNGGDNTITYPAVNVSNGGGIQIRWTDDWGAASYDSVKVNGKSLSEFGFEVVQWYSQNAYYGSEEIIKLTSITTDLNLTIETSHRIKTNDDTYSAVALGGSSTGSSSGDKVRSDDDSFSKTITLNASNRWTHEWTISDDERATPKVEGDIVLPKTDSKGNEYYYYVVETPVTDYETTYSPASGGIKTGKLKVINTGEGPQTGSLKLTKVVQVDGDTPSTDAEKNLVNGDYVFTVSSGNSIVKYVQITVTNGVPASYKIADTQAALESVGSVEGTSALVSGLDKGDYVITEIEKNGMTLKEAARGDNDTDAVSDDKAVTVHVTAGENEPADISAAAATFTNNIKTTTFEFGKQWIGIGQKEIEWDRDIQVTVGRSSENGGADNNFSLVYNIAKRNVAGSGTVEFAANGATETTPKLQLTIAADGTTKKYNFKIEDLDYASESDGKYTYFVKETNSQLTGYLAPIYTNASAPTGAEAAYHGGTIVNKQEGGYELPSTGGHGTLPLTGAGALLLLLAGTALTVRKLLIQRNTGKGGRFRIR